MEINSQPNFKTMSKQKSKDSLEDVILRRNRRLQDFFKSEFPEEFGTIRIIGDENVPAVILNDEYLVACYVKNFDLFLQTTNEDNGGEIFMTIKLNKIPEYNRDEFIKWIQTARHRKVYRIKLSQTPNELYLCGWNYIDKELKDFRYPVFSKYNPKVYYKEKVAEEFAEELKEYGYLIDII